MTKLFIDIETIPVPVSEREFLRPTPENVKYGNATKEDTRKRILDEAIQSFETGEDAALDALSGKIALIGYAIDDEPVKIIDNDNEKEMLQEFKNVVNKCIDYNPDVISNPIFIGHNIINFDIPYIFRRNFKHGIKTSYLLMNMHTLDYNSIMDTMRMWCLNRHDMISLKNLASFFGIDMVDNGVTGKEFYKFFATDKQKCIDKCIQDVEVVRQVYNKMA